jgi:ABC-type proline/glycine betaine transport system permease subunit
VYQGIQQNDIAKGFESGLGIVILAIILDRTTQACKNNNRKINNIINKYNYVEIEKVRNVTCTY